MKRGRSGGPPSKTQRDAYRARVDREAAAIILQDELDARAGRRRTTGRRRMTIRSGKRPRDSREWQARPFEPDAYATRVRRRLRRAAPTAPQRRRRSGRASGLLGLLKFLVFALVLAAVVLVVAADRPPAARQGRRARPRRRTIPAALQVPFVKDIVREDLGAALTEPVSDDPTQVDSPSSG